MQFQFRSNGSIVIQNLDHAARRIADPRPVLEDIGEHMVNSSVPENFARGGRPDPWPRSAWSSERQLVNTNRLQTSIRYEIAGGKVRVGTNLVYAQQRQFGGLLVPKASRYLVVPLPSVPRTMRRPSAWGSRLSVVLNKEKRPIGLGVRAGRKGKRYTRLLFLLKTSVNQPARPFLLWQAEDQAYVMRAVARHALAEVG